MLTCQLRRIFPCHLLPWHQVDMAAVLHKTRLIEGRWGASGLQNPWLFGLSSTHQLRTWWKTELEENCEDSWKKHITICKNERWTSKCITLNLRAASKTFTKSVYSVNPFICFVEGFAIEQKNKHFRCGNIGVVKISHTKIRVKSNHDKRFV